MLVAGKSFWELSGVIAARLRPGDLDRKFDERNHSRASLQSERNTTLNNPGPAAQSREVAARASGK